MHLHDEKIPQSLLAGSNINTLSYNGRYLSNYGILNRDGNFKIINK
jgi:hypothetical protein